MSSKPAKSAAPAQSSAPSPWRQAVSYYAAQSRRPLASLAFVVPLLVLYEGGILFLGPQAVRNGADVWLRRLLDAGGFSQYFLLPGLCIGLLLAWHHVTRDRWQVSAGVLYVMLAECAVWGFALMVLGRLEATLAEATLLGENLAQATPAAVPWALAPRGVVMGRLLGFVGAGIYEELLFRLLLLPPIAAAAKVLGAQQGLRIACAIVLTSVVFAAAHYIGPQGEAWDAFTFSFRLSAGAFFAILFVFRGFGVAAGAHALYDIFVSLS